MAVGVKAVFIPKNGEGNFLKEFAHRLERLHAHIKEQDSDWSWCKFARATGETIQHFWEYRRGRRFVGPRFLFSVITVARRYKGGLDILLGEEGKECEGQGGDGRDGREPPPSRYSSLLASGEPAELYLRGRRRRRRTTTRR